ncbi:hypothetical protein ACNPIS_31930, partial [Paenibacillus apiarius]
MTIKIIRSDHGGEFENQLFYHFCIEKEIIHEFSSARTPQQNGVVERKNRTLQEMARTMLSEYKLPKYFWAEAVSTACHVCNRVYLRPILGITSFQLYYQKSLNIAHLRVFGCKCFLLNTKDHLGKFDAKADECIVMGYSSSSKAYRVYNKRSNLLEESIHVRFDETNTLSDLID